MANKKSLLREIESKNREIKWWHHRIDSIVTLNRMMLNREEEFKGKDIIEILEVLRQECEKGITDINAWFNTPNDEILKKG